MAASQSPDSDKAKTLLRNVLEDPLGLGSKAHVHDWLQFLRSEFPLWSFQARSYMDLHRRAKEAVLGDPDTANEVLAAAHRWHQEGLVGWLGILPTAYPLQSFVAAILDDEGIGVRNGATLTPLEHTLDIRRAWLAAVQPGFLKLVPVCGEDWDPRRPLYPSVFGQFSARQAAVEMDAASAYDPGDPATYVSPYDDIGRDLVEHVENWISARGKTERDDRREELDDLPLRVAAELGLDLRRRGRRFEGPRPDILRALVQQGRSLVELCWNLFLTEVGDALRDAYVEHHERIDAAVGDIVRSLPGRPLRAVLEEINDPDGQRLWAARLALPVLSKCELLALRAESREAAQRTRGKYPTPKRLAVWVVAHRLGLFADSVARKALGSDSKYFQGRQNPVDHYC